MYVCNILTVFPLIFMLRVAFFVGLDLNFALVAGRFLLRIFLNPGSGGGSRITNGYIK